MSKLYLLTGLTGSGKTRILQYLSTVGYQTLDLENIADHSGSVFGGINRHPLLSQQVFTQNLWFRFQQYSTHKMLFMEWKGTVIGELYLPAWFLELQKKATTIFIDTPYNLRVQHVLIDYKSLTLEQLEAGLYKIENKINGELKAEAKKQFADKNRTGLIETLIKHFDTTSNYAGMKAAADIIIDVTYFSEERIIVQLLQSIAADKP